VAIGLRIVQALLKPARKIPPACARHPRVLGLAVLLFVAGIILAHQVGDNFHAVIPNRVYRSGQLSGKSLEHYIMYYHLRSIINLRGPNPEDEWYQIECGSAAHLGVQHYDVPIDSGCPPNPDELRDLVTVLQKCPKPVLLHCQSGIDRSGIAAAISRLLLDDTVTPAEAKSQFRLLYGHFPWRESTAKHKAFLDLYEAWLTENGLPTSSSRFREWALNVYNPPPELDNRVISGLLPPASDN
jgi:protein tyrosine phosphatase (PTP) superfamily phosphohydrolase (DUF442 family)